VYCISLEPGNDNVFCSASDDGRVLIFDTRKEPAENSIFYSLFYFLKN